VSKNTGKFRLAFNRNLLFDPNFEPVTSFTAVMRLVVLAADLRERPPPSQDERFITLS
jgi:hypothetical protein